MKEFCDFVAPYLDPYMQWLPDGVRTWMLGEEGIVLTLALIFLLFVAVLAIIVRFIEKFFGGIKRMVTPKQPDRTELRLVENLADLPPVTTPPGPAQLCWYHVPGRVRLIVLAPLGRDEKIDAGNIYKLLDRMVPGLGTAAKHDEPTVRLWPNQLSDQGFSSVFHRCTPRPEREGQESRWIVLAGKTQIGKQPYLLGLAMLADQPVVQERVTLQPMQWMDLLRIKS